MSAFTIFDEAGRPIAFAIASRDIRERKAADAEKKLLTDQLIQAQKMESIGRLAGGVAHDFNNLLTPIMGYSELLNHDLPDNAAALAKIGNILKAADRARVLVQQLLSFSRKNAMEMKILDLNRTISSVHSILRHTILESIDIRLCLAEESYCIRADRNQIEQVIMNLAVNAQDAIGEHGVITIETAPVLLDDEYACQHSGVKPGRYLMLAVTDDGCGMDQETQQRIFEPFFTTKGIGKGTGLGLATVYGIVRQHGGSIWVYSEPDHGTTFKCYFPLVDELPVSEQAPAHEQVSLVGGKRTILLVEDNEMVRALVYEQLTRQGVEVLVAEEPKQALRISESRSLDLLITDVVMPGMTGFDLHTKLLERYPGLKVLFMSGYSSTIIAGQMVLDKGAHYLEKPFSITAFARKVEMLLKS
jgi:signal transduction histidine kinase